MKNYLKNPLTLVLCFLLTLMMSCQKNQNKPTIKEPTAQVPQNFIFTNPSCMDDPTVDACIFWKNPVAQKGSPLSSGADITSTLKDLQTYGVNFSETFNTSQKPENLLNAFRPRSYNFGMIELKDQGFSYSTEDFARQNQGVVPYTNSYNSYDNDSQDIFLENSSYTITINYGNAQRVTPKADGSWKFEYGDSNHSVAQVMAYYYLMKQMQWMEENAGGWYAKGKNITVVALDENIPNSAFWSPYDNTIALGVVCHPRVSRNAPCHFKMEMALNAEAILHEAGHANFDFSASTRLSRGGYCLNHKYGEGFSICDERYYTDTKSRDIFCASEKGCYYAISEGAGDFHVALRFPNAPQMGETLTNHTEGMTCRTDSNILRNPESNTELTANTLFHQCNSNGPSGEVHEMGMLYTSIWWSLYTHPEANQTDIAHLFTEHLPLLTFDDTFETVGYKLLNLDQSFYRGKYTHIINEEFRKRGLTLRPDSLSL